MRAANVKGSRCVLERGKVPVEHRTSGQPDGGRCADHVMQRLALLGLVYTRRMFGGLGIYHEGVMIALIADDVLYLKTDAQSRHVFECAGSTPFAYAAKGKQVTTSYRRAPDDALASSALALSWARLACAAALRARALKPARGSREGNKP